jgi:ABC-type antimicrobial peptide transport system permease subunit
MALYGSIDVAGQTIWLEVNDWNKEARKMVKIKEPRTIRAVVENVRNNYDDAEYCLIFICNYQTCYSPFIVRLCDGVNAERFVEQCKNEMKHDLITEQFFINTIKSSREQLENELNTYSSRDSRRNMLIAAFFICNLTFGVIGTLLMYTRQRKEEAGVKMAFGATRLSIFLGFLREAWLITTFSVLIGCIFYFQLAYASGLYVRPVCYQGNHYWFDSFGSHFLVVSLCVYLIILCFVLLGTIIPAWRISRSKITEALKE